MTRDVERAKKFYADTLGWTFDGMPMPGGTYWVAKAGGEIVGGGFVHTQAPLGWLGMGVAAAGVALALHNAPKPMRNGRMS
jgi:predicted enzyme related to lactoylglutathione lyase